MENNPKIAIIMRDDEVIEKYNLKRITVSTSFGPVNRCYVGNINGVQVLIIYGRFAGEKVPSDMINYEQNIEIVKNLGINKLIGTFVVGGINPNMPRGSVHILGDMVAMGNYHIGWNQNASFHNAEMYEPFCPQLTHMLKEAGEKMEFPINNDATYVCFHGYPRIETKAELDFYRRNNWDIVGQTCDPEATLSRINSICYAGVAVQIDDPNSRSDYVKNLKEIQEAKMYLEDIKSCRKRTSKVVLQFLEDYKDYDCGVCRKMCRKNNNFREFPDSFYD